MAYYSIEKRLRPDGTARYRCAVGVKKGGKYIYRENRTFGRQAHAKTWGGGKAGCAKSYVLNMLLDCDIAVIKLTDFQTSHDLSYLSSVLATARLIFGIDYTGLYPKSLHDKFNLLNRADSGQ